MKSLRFSDIEILKKWLSQNKTITNGLIRDYLNNSKKANEGLKSILEWSLSANKRIKILSSKIKPIPEALKAMDLLKEKADIVVVSNTPTKTLFREWKYNNIISKVLLIGGQETGTKSQMIESATKYKYHNNKILVIGDSFADLNAANDNKALFIQLYHQRKKNRGIFF